MVCDICYSSLNKRLQRSCKLNLFKKKPNGDQLHGLRAIHFRFLQPDFFIARNGNDHASTKKNPDNYFHEYENIRKVSLKANQSRTARSTYIPPPPPTDLIWSYLSAHQRLSLGLLLVLRTVAGGLFSPLIPRTLPPSAVPKSPDRQSLRASAPSPSLRVRGQVSRPSGGMSCSASSVPPSALRGASAALCRCAGRTFSV